jgi:hypothetical protein
MPREEDAKLTREDFSSHDPWDGAPRSCEEALVESSQPYSTRQGRENTDNVDTHESNQDFLPGEILRRDGHTSNSDGILANHHTQCTNQEQVPPADLVDKVYSRDGHADIDNIGYNGLQEWIAKVGVLEESGAVVENEVDAGKLLPPLEEDAGESAEENAVAAIAEAIGVGGLADLFFVLKISANLAEIRRDARVIVIDAGETR